MYSKEFIKLNLNYAQIVAQKTGISFIHAVIYLTCIRRTILGVSFGEQGTSVPTSDINRVRAGRLSATLPDHNGLSLIHFSENKDESNPLGEAGLIRRKVEMTEVLRELYRYIPTEIGMFSWLLDGRFQILFPNEVKKDENPNSFYQSLAVYGQYLLYDGTINLNRANELINRARTAKDLYELLDAHPKKALQIRTPAYEMFQMYSITQVGFYS